MENLHKIFELKARTYPDRTAVEEESATIVYEELNNRANRLAHALQQNGVKKDVVVATFMRPGVKQVSSLLASMKAGGIYMPMDMSLPEKRLKQIFNQTFSGIIVADSRLKISVENLIAECNVQVHTIIIVEDRGNIVTLKRKSGAFKIDKNCKNKEDNLNAQIGPEYPCYIFYTSGSTGEAKAILGNHKSLSHFIEWEIEEFEIGPGSRIAQIAQITFDASLKDILTAICSGATLCIPSVSTRENMTILTEWLLTRKISVLQCVPSIFRLITQTLQTSNKKYEFPELKLVALAGELLYAKDIRNWRAVVAEDIEIVNLYGPTEATILKTYHRIRQTPENPSEIIHVGKAIPGSVVAVINDGHICRTGEKGEVYIKSDYLTYGYLNDEELQSQRFVQNPLIRNRKEIVYKTGDIGRYDSDGNIEILGRLDNQLKINGVRVELGEIEGAVLGIEDINEAVVVPHENQNHEIELICYHTNQEIDLETLRRELKKTLPERLIPAHFIALEKLTYNINGKINRKALPKPEKLITNCMGYDPPKTQTEQKLETLWKDVLCFDRVGRDVSFFKLGGHSLKALKLVSRIYQTFNVNVKIADIFSNPTIARLASVIDQTVKRPYDTIPNVTDQPCHDVSPAQKRLWVLNKYEGENNIYNMNGTYILKGPVNTDALEKAFLSVIERHETLRTTFCTVNGNPKQKINDVASSGFKFHYQDISDEDDVEKTARAIAKEQATAVFDLEKGPLIRVALLRLSNRKFVFIFVLHHIIGDDWSIELLFKDVLNAYVTITLGEPNPLAPLRIQYKDYVAWQKNLLKKEVQSSHKNYWHNKLKGELQSLQLPTSFPRPKIKSNRVDSQSFTIDKDHYALLKRMSERHEASMFMVCAALFKTLLYRYTRQNDIIIGTPVTGREHPELEGQIGFYLNILLLRTRLTGEESFEQTLMAVKQTALEAYDHSIYPYDQLADELGLLSKDGRSSFHDVGITWHTEVEKAPSEVDFFVDQFDSGFKAAKSDLWLHGIENPDKINFIVEYRTDLFSAKYIERFIARLQTIVSVVAKDSEVLLKDLQYLPRDERCKVVKLFNEPAFSAFEERTIAKVFEERVRKNPQAIAVAYKNTKLTYSELNRKANKLAHFLRSNYKIKPDDVVALMTSRSEKMIMAILAIIKAGGAFLPVNPQYPNERISYILSDARVKTLLTESEYLLRVTDIFEGNLIALDVQLSQITASSENPSPINTSSDLAYVIYTSGSTGRPKGVMIEHRSNINMCLDQIERLQMSQKDKMLQFASLSFDAAVYEIFITLYSGAALEMVDEEIINDSKRFVDMVVNNEVSIVVLPPTYLNILDLARLKSLRAIVTAGDSPNFQDALYCSESSLYFNAYGPTECAVCVSIYQFNDQEDGQQQIPIGKPISNIQMYILDENLQPTGIGVEGEICVSGIGLARGYVGKQSLTRQKFIDHPFIEGEKMYLTGDWGKWREDGAIEFIGRKDSQIKLWGNRIELGEIKNTLLRLDEVDDAIIVPQKIGDVKIIVAYLKVSVTENDASPSEENHFSAISESAGDCKQLIRKIDAEDIKMKLSEYLPDYMIPGYFLGMAEFPVTINGKINYEALPGVAELTNQRSKTYQGPRNQPEEQISAIWREVLGIKELSVDDNFFEIGGHSLKAIQISSRMADELNLTIDLKSFFSNPTVEMLAKNLGASSVPLNDEMIKAPESEYYALSHAQKRLWILAQFEENERIYNIPIAFLINEPVDKETLAKSLQILIDRHEILRTTFISVAGEPKQRINSPEVFGCKLKYIDLRNSKNAESDLKETVEKLEQFTFDLAKGPLINIHLIQLDEEKFILHILLHHIIADDWSLEVFYKEIFQLYESLKKGMENPLPPLQIQYKDFAFWQNKKLEAGLFDEDRNYWIDQFSGEIPELELSKDYSRGGAKTYNGDYEMIRLDRGLTTKLKQISREEGVSLFMTMLALFKTLLFKYANQEDIILGSPAAGRDGRHLEGQIGFYVNILPLRTKFKGDDTFRNLLKKIKETTLNAYQHQSYPFDLLIDELNLERNVNDDVLYNAGFTWHAQALFSKEDFSHSANISTYNSGVTSAKTDMWLHGMDSNDSVILKLIYNTDLFAHDKVRQFMAHFQSLINSVVENIDRPLRRLNFLLENEKENLLQEQDTEPIAERTVHELVALQSKNYPEQNAIVMGKEVVTYQELDRRANQLANHLVEEYAIKKGEIVALLTPPSIESMIAVLAILKSGGVYLPIDPEYPNRRINYILSDADVRLAFTESNLLMDLAEIYSGRVFALDVQLAALDASMENPAVAIDPEDLAYIIYTSGSTGQPKGVMIKHRNVVNLLQGLARVFDFDHTWKSILVASISFDASIRQIFLPLIQGGELHIYGDRKDLTGLFNYIKENEINAVHATPLFWQWFVKIAGGENGAPYIKLLSCGGDRMSKSLAKELKLQMPYARIFNVYGPTEATVLASFYEIKEWPTADPPIGKALPNYRLYVLDSDHNLLPNGVKGELYIGGAGVAAGYINCPQLTVEKFIDNPFKPDEKLYKTGDLAKRLSDGNIVFMGRNDNQVKIRGHRIDFSEIENTLLEHGGIEECVAAAYGDDERRELIAYVKTKEKMVARPSWAEQFVYDDMAYYAMSKDEFRNNQYKKAIGKQVKDKVVLEIGPGSEAILSIMCIEKGARKVYAVEIFEEAYRKAKQKIKSLGLEDRVIVMLGDIMNVNLPEKIDCCVSEIVGSIGGSQGAAKIMNNVRRLLVNPERMIPARSLTKIAAVSMPFTDFDYEFDEVGAHYAEQIFNNRGRRFDLRLCIQNFDSKFILSDDDFLEDLDYRKENKLESEHQINLTMEKRGIFKGMIVWLKLYLDDRIVIDSLTRGDLWLPMYLPVFDDGVEVEKGDNITASVTRKLSQDGLHPDFIIEGALYRNELILTKFRCRSYNEEQGYKTNGFYRRLFKNDDLKISRGTSGGEIKEYLAKRLPDYMTPASLVKVDAFPQNVNGKINMNELPKPLEEDRSRANSYIKPRNKLEAIVAEIWSEILGKKQIGVRDNFFELGGHSLKATQLVAKIYKELNAQIDLRSVFSKPTIEAIAEEIKKTGSKAYTSIPRIARQPYYNLSHAQKRLWLIAQSNNSAAFNISNAYTLEGKLDLNAFEKSFESLVKRHEILRTIFTTVLGEPKQRVLKIEESGFRVNYFDLRLDPDRRFMAKDIAVEDAQKLFDIAEGPLLRATLLHIEDEEFIFLFTMHHIIADGWSMGILIKEVMDLYNAFAKKISNPLLPLPIQYKDFCDWQNNLLQGASLQTMKNYWLGQFEGDIPVLELPTDFPRPKSPTYKGDSFAVVFNKELSDGLKAMSPRHGNTLFVTLVSIVNILLHKCTGQTDIVVGVITAGRDHHDLEGQIGNFLNVLPLRNKINSEINFTGMLKEVNQIVLGAFDNQIYPFDLLVSDLNFGRDRGRSPLYDVEVELVNVEQIDYANTFAGIAVKPYDNGYAYSKDDLSFRFIDSEKIVLSIQYKTDLFERSTIKQYADYLKRIVEQTVESEGNISLDDIQCLSQEEETLIMQQFNSD